MDILRTAGIGMPEGNSPIPAGGMSGPHLSSLSSRLARALGRSAIFQAAFPNNRSQFANKVFGALGSLIAYFEGLFGSPIGSENPASKECKRLAYEMRQTLRIKGFVLNLADSASLATGLPACWDAARPCLETPELEDAAAEILAEASRLAEDLGETNHKSSLRLSHDEASHLQSGLDFYHFLLPKMLVLTSALRLVCDQELLKRGIVGGHAPESKTEGADGLHDLFQNIRGILSLSPVEGSVPMPRAWSKYLAAASAQLRPVVLGENYNRASNQLRTISRQSAPGFQDRIGSVELDSLEAIAKQVSKLEALLPSLIISLTLLELYFRPADRPTPARPAPSRPIPEVSPEMAPERSGKRQPMMALSTRTFGPA